MNAFRFPTAEGLLTIVAGLTLSLAISALSATGHNGAHQAPASADKTQSATGAVSGSGVQPSPSPRCDIAGAKAIRITCHYSASPLTDVGNREPRVVLNDAVLMFKTRDDNYMHVDLTFTNDGKNAILDAHPVYLEIDDDAGNNYVRRPLPHVDFRNLPPGGQRTFSERLLAPAFQPRPYIIWLWIPDPDPSSKFDSAHNFLLSSAGVPDSKSGLNLIAKFSVAR
jgi:hypothetical protein